MEQPVDTGTELLTISFTITKYFNW